MHQLTMAALKAAVLGGQSIMKVYEKDDFDVRFKTDDSPLTEADVNSHLAITTSLKSTGIPILSEEGDEIAYSVRNQWPVLWVVDPLDGTKEFVKRNGEFTVNVALVENHFPVLGVVLAPFLNCIYWGDEAGAYKSILPKKWLKKDSMEVVTDLSPVRLPAFTCDTFTMVASVSHYTKETKLYAERLRSKTGEIENVAVGSSLKMCVVAEGKAHLYPRLGPTMEWDTAAGQAVVEAAGGCLMDWETKERMQYNRPNLLNGWFLTLAKGLNPDEYWLLDQNDELKQ